MIFDSHSHTAFSADSEMKAADAIAMAEKAGVGLVFTEHLDLDYPGEMDFSFDPQAYWQAYEPYRGDNLRLGIEIGMNEAILEGNLHFLEQEPFDLVIGHIDYISRYAPYDDPEVSYGAFQEDIDRILRAAIETDTVLELNTRRLGSRLACKELMPVYARYRELGGRYVTLGSDAHTSDAVAVNFGAAEELAAMVGLGLVTFAERRMVPCTK